MRFLRWTGVISTAFAVLAIAPAAHAVDTGGFDSEWAVDDEQFTLAVDLPEITIAAGSSVCTFTDTRRANFSHASGSTVVRQTSSIRASTPCNTTMRVATIIVDEAPLSPTYRMSSGYRSGLKTATAAAAQSVPYFTAQGAPTRPYSTLRYLYIIDYQNYHYCFEQAYTLINGQISNNKGVSFCNE